jgi:hypothetical protein
MSKKSLSLGASLSDERYPYDAEMWRRHGHKRARARGEALAPKGQRRWRLSGESELNGLLLAYHAQNSIHQLGAEAVF